MELCWATAVSALSMTASSARLASGWVSRAAAWMNEFLASTRHGDGRAAVELVGDFFEFLVGDAHSEIVVGDVGSGERGASSWMLPIGTNVLWIREIGVRVRGSGSGRRRPSVRGWCGFGRPAHSGPRTIVDTGTVRKPKSGLGGRSGFSHWFSLACRIVSTCRGTAEAAPRFAIVGVCGRRKLMNTTFHSACGRTWANVALAVATALAAGGQASATITLGSLQVEAQGGVEVSGTPTIGFSGTGTAGDPYKISGHAEFLNGDSGPADIRLLGTLSATAGEQIVALYDLTTTFIPDYDPAYGGDLILRGAVYPDSLPGIGFQLDPGYRTIGLGTEEHHGGGIFEIPFDMTSASFVIELHMYLGQQGTLLVDIPANSIDFSLVPEPSAVMLAALASCGVGGFFRTVRRSRSRTSALDAELAGVDEHP